MSRPAQEGSGTDGGAVVAAGPGDPGGAGVTRTAQPDVETAAELLRSRFAVIPEVALVLGSGLAGLTEELDSRVSVDFGELPGFPPSGVEGHTGRYIGGRLGGVPLLVQSGRYHYYEGHPGDVVAAPVRTAGALGIRIIVFTNASGGIREGLTPGRAVLIDDHINLMFRSPLVGPRREGEERFPDMSAPYDPKLQALTLRAAEEVGVPLARGTYAAVLGPAYETAAEVRMLERMGADVVGMSTVPEVLVARARGMRCLALSLVTNRATGLGERTLSHDEVVEVGREAAGRMGRLLAHLLPSLASRTQSGSVK